MENRPQRGAENRPAPAAKPSSGEKAAKRSRPVTERACRRVVARHRRNVDWMLHIPEWNYCFEYGLIELDLPQPRRGINFQTLLDSLLLEHKYQLVVWAIDSYREQFPSLIATKLLDFYGIKHFTHLELDEYLTEEQWMKFRDYFHSSLVWAHQRYKRSQTILFRRYQSMLHKTVNRNVFDPQMRQDAYQEACIGLLHAIDKVEDNDASFGSYAKMWVSRHIRNFLMGEHFPVHVPINLASKLLCLANTAEEDDRESAQKAAQHPHGHLLKPRMSIEEMAEDERGGHEIPDLGIRSPAENLTREDLFNEMRSLLEELTEKQRDVIALRYGLNGSPETHTLSTIARRVGISHQQVSMREKRALEKLESLLRPLYHETVR